MPNYGPWVQPVDTTTAPSVAWFTDSGTSEGSVADPRTDVAQWAASVSTAQSGTGSTPPPNPIIAGVTSSALATMAESGHTDVSGSASVARAKVAILAPDLATLAYAPVGPAIFPPNVVGIEYEHPAGTPLPNTLRIYGYSVTFANSLGGTDLRGARLNRLSPGDYFLDGLARPNAAWSAVRSSGSTVATFAPPGVSGTYTVAAFDLPVQSLDANGYAVYALVTAYTDGTWTVDESATVQVRNSVPTSPPSVGSMPTFTQDYTPPRYRLIYSTLPRLRQWPRDDFLGGVARQEGSRSVQASHRQGWGGSYR